MKVELTEHPKNPAETSRSEEERVYTSAAPTSGGGSWLDQIQPRLHFGHKARRKIPRADGERISKKRTMQFNKGNNVKSICVFHSLERTYDPATRLRVMVVRRLRAMAGAQFTKEHHCFYDFSYLILFFRTCM